MERACRRSSKASLFCYPLPSASPTRRGIKKTSSSSPPPPVPPPCGAPLFFFLLSPSFFIWEAYAEGSWPFLLSLTSLKLEDFPLASEKELAMARGEGRPEGAAALFGGVPGGVSTSAGGAGTGAAAEHRSLEEVFAVDEGRVLNLKGFVQEDFGVVFDEVR